MRHKTIRARERALDARLGKLFCNFDMGSDAPAPDPLIGQAALANTAIAKDALDWYKAKDAADKPMRDAATAAATDAAQVQAETARKQNAMADETYAYTKGTFRPLEQKMAGDAIGYDTPQRREQEAAQAIADVGTQMGAQKKQVMADLASRGVDPSSGSAAIALARMGIGTGAAAAAAGNQARKNVEAVGGAKVADAVAMGRGIASTNATQTQLGLQAGNSSVANAQVPLAISAQQGAQMGQGFGIGIQGNGSAGSILAQQYGTQVAAANGSSAATGSALSGAGAAIGGIAMAV